MSPSAVAMVHGLRGDDAAREEWLAILATIRGVDLQHASRGSGYGPIFDALVALHRGRPEEALPLLAADPRAAPTWWEQVFHQWCSALRSEAAVLADCPDTGKLIEAAKVETARNPLATALVQRAGALMTGDRTALLATADMFAKAGCRYQMARTLVLAGGQASTTGRAALAEMGAAAMVI